MHARTPYLALALVLAGCSAGGQPAASPTATTTSPPATPAVTAGPAVARLAYSDAEGMHVQGVDAGGHLAGAPAKVGPADRTSRPEWSPKGRYLVWTTESAPDSNGDLAIYDTRTGTLHLEPGFGGVGYGVSSASTGAVALAGEDDTYFDVTFYGMTGQSASRTGGSGDFPQHLDAVVVGHDAAVVEDTHGGPGAALVLLPEKGANVVVGHVAPLPSGDTTVPSIGAVASTLDGTTAALVTRLRTNGRCAGGQTVHVVDLRRHADRVVALPRAGSDLLAPSYSPDGVLGGIATDCADGTDGGNAFVELHGTAWTTVAPGAVVAARGPRGLLAVQDGTFTHDGEHVPVPSADQPLRIRDAGGAVTATLVPSWAACWTATAAAPR